VCGGQGVIPHPDLGSDKVWAGRPGRTNGNLVIGWLEPGEVLLSKLDELLMGDTSGTNENHAVSLVVGVDVVDEVGTLDGENVLLWPENGAAKRLTLESGGMEVIEDDFLELAVDFLLFADDDASLSLNGIAFEFRVLDDVGKDLDGLGGVILEGFGIIDGVLALWGHQ